MNLPWDRSTPVYKINDCILKYTNYVRDLGVIVDCNLKFEQHITYPLLCIKHTLVLILF